MKNNNSLISVLMPVYNVKEYLNMAVDSVLNQTFSNFELIIINDGSTDSSGAYDSARLRALARPLFSI